jgi:antitoxin HigA-1
MPMHDPPHPGEVIRELCLKPLGLTVTAAARGLGVSRKALSELLNGHAGISPEMAIRLARAFGGSAESWLLQQMQHDLWHAMQRADGLAVERFVAA